MIILHEGEWLTQLSRDAKSLEALEELEEPMLIFQVLENDTKSVLLLSWKKDVSINFFQVFQVL